MFPFVYSQSYSASPRLRATNHLKHQENLQLERWPEVRSCIWIIGCPLLPFSCHVVRSLRAGNHSICHRLVLYSIDIAKTRLYYNRHLHNLRFALLKFWVRCLETHFFHFLPTYFLVVAGLQWYTVIHHCQSNMTAEQGAWEEKKLPRHALNQILWSAHPRCKNLST